MLSALSARAPRAARHAAASPLASRRLYDAALGLAGAVAWASLAFVILRWPDLGDWGRGP